MKGIIKQKCPACDVMLTFEIKTVDTEPNDKGGNTITVNFQTAPESTEHVWTHHPDAKL